MNKEKIFCETLKHWCTSMSEAAELADCDEKHLAYVLNTEGRYRGQNGLLFTKHLHNSTALTTTPTSTVISNSNKKAVKVVCESTGEYFDSILAFSKYMDVPATKITYDFINYGYVTDKFGKKWVRADKKGGTKIHRTKEELRAFRLEILAHTQDKICKKIICIETQEEFSSLKEAAKHLNITTWTLSYHIKKHGVFVKDGKSYTFADKANMPVATLKSAKSTRGKKAREITCLQTGEKFKSANVLSSVVGVTGPWISHLLKEEGQFKRNGKTYVYSDKISPAKATSDGNVIVCQETGDRFESIEIFSKYVGKSIDLVTTVFKNNGKYMRDGLTYILEVASPQLKVEVKEEAQPEVVETPAQVTTKEKQQELPIVKIAKKVTELHEKVYDEQIALQDTLVSFVRKKMYIEASILCETLQKIYMK